MSGLFFLASMLFLFLLDSHAKIDDLYTITWVHLYSIGFILISMLASLSQLVPVLGEVKLTEHRSHHLLAQALFIIVVLFVIGFLYSFKLLAIVAFTFILIMSIHAYGSHKLFLNAKRLSVTLNMLALSNLLLPLALLSGLATLLTLLGLTPFLLNEMLFLHVSFTLFGLLMFLTFNLSTLLIPMFASSKKPSKRSSVILYASFGVSLVLVLLSALTQSDPVRFAGLLGFIATAALFFMQLYTMYATHRARWSERWLWYMHVAYGSLFAALLLFISYIYSLNNLCLTLSMWFLFVGYFGFLTIGNLLKIIPFLIWFEYYAPLLETQNVPMIHELIDQKRLKIQFGALLAGLVLCSSAFIAQSDLLYFVGVCFLVTAGAIFLLILNKLNPLNK